ncbi:MAG: dihydroorotate dehydrogenase [Desulfovibrionales bacterium GWA2_65_9]|nr:MAG: dihydroorotate dehydrogenase [Desulfovibrionales bacterium GWA2_65_9]
MPDSPSARPPVRPVARLVYVTAPSLAEAESLARLAVTQRLAACANILPGMRSLYWWQGQLEQADEVVLLLKTTAALAGELTAVLAEAHSYDCPCVVVLPIEGGHPAFLDWIEAETGNG